MLSQYTDASNTFQPKFCAAWVPKKHPATFLFATYSGHCCLWLGSRSLAVTERLRPRGWQVRAGGAGGNAVSETPDSPTRPPGVRQARFLLRLSPAHWLTPQLTTLLELPPSFYHLQASITSQSSLIQLKCSMWAGKIHHWPQLTSEGSVQAEICLDFLTPMGLYRDINS